MQREKKNIRIELNSNKRYTYIYIYSIFFHEYLLPSISTVDP